MFPPYRFYALTTGRRSLMNTPQSENSFLPVYGHMTIFLLYPTFYIEFTIPCHDVYLLHVNSIRVQIKSLGEGMAALQ